ncbi:GntR family transcriptional regulator [Escherichia coli]
MEITEPRRLYQQLAADLKERIEQGVYLVGDKLPAERFIADEKNVSRTVVREAIIMLEVEGYVEVRKGSGIHVVSNQPRHQQAADNNMEFANYGPFELLQARQLIESNIAEFAATQVTKQDIMKLMAIQEQARGEQCFRDSEWDLQFHIQVALATQNSAHKHGLSALLIGRFIAFVRTLLPTIAGLSGLNNARFQFFNWMSGLLWVLILTTLGYMLGKTPVFLKYEDQLMSCLMLLPVVLLVFGLAGSLVVLWKKKYGNRG